jgi:hypothetical protein
MGYKLLHMKHVGKSRLHGDFHETLKKVRMMIAAIAPPHLVRLAVDGDRVHPADVSNADVLITQQVVSSCRCSSTETMHKTGQS